MDLLNTHFSSRPFKSNNNCWFLISNMNSAQSNHIFTFAPFRSVFSFASTSTQASSVLTHPRRVLVCVNWIAHSNTIKTRLDFCMSELHILSLWSNIFNIYVTFNWKFLFEKCTWNYHVNRWTRNIKSNVRRFYSIFPLPWYSKRTETPRELRIQDARARAHFELAISFVRFSEKRSNWIFALNFTFSESVKCSCYDSNQICDSFTQWFYIGSNWKRLLWRERVAEQETKKRVLKLSELF